MASQYRVITLTKGYCAIVSAADYRRVARYNWHVHVSKGTKKKPGQPYARATIDGKKVYLHRFIANAPTWLQVDHKNHQTLDCRRENLEAVAHIENQRRRRNVKPKGYLVTTTEINGVVFATSGVEVIQ